MAYTAWSVVFGEQPTAAKWNQLGQNDAGFKDGSNIDSGAITAAKIAAGAVSYDKNDFTTHHAIKLRATTNTTITNTNTTIAMATTEYSRGTALTKSGNTILVGSGVSLVRVMAGMCFETFSSGGTYAFCRIQKNAGQESLGLIPSTNGFAFMAMCAIVAVTNGDTLSLTADVGAGTAVASGTTRKIYISAEAIG